MNKEKRKFERELAYRAVFQIGFEDRGQSDLKAKIMATLDNAISFNDTNDVSITKAPEEIESEPIVHNGTDAMDELRRLAKQKRSKEDIVKKWKVINPFGTQKQCARDLNISLKTVKKWW